MNITITQDNNTRESLGPSGASIIEKLYNLAIDSNNTLTLEGWIYTPYAYGYLVDYLNTNYGPDFKVTVDGKYIRFEDPNVITHLSLMNIGTNGMVTEDLAAAVTVISNIENNNTVTKFNELRYFTNVTEGKGGWNSPSDGSCKFLSWTALEEIDISNFTSIGHGNRNSYGDTFRGCASLKKVTASSKLKKLGFCAFCYCSNLEEISGLTGTILIEGNAFHDCNKLKQSSILNCTFTYSFSNGYDPQEIFRECWAITSVSLDPSMTILPVAMFYRCSNLTTVSGLDNITHYREQAFRYCSNFEGPLDLSNVVSIGLACFDGCEKVSIDAGTISSAITTVESYTFNECKRLVGIINLPNLTSLGQAAFSNCSNITAVLNLGSIVSIPESCFYGCGGLTSISFPQNISSIGDGAFNKCRSLALNISTLPQSITYIGDFAFLDCTNVAGTLSLPNLTYIGDNAFRNTNVTSISNLGSITTLSGGTFFGCRNLTSVLLPSTLTTISVEAFSDTAITRLLIPEGVTTIQDGSFLDCSPNISYVELPSTVSNINFLFHRMFEAVSASDSVVVVIKATTPPQARYYASWAADSTNVTKCRGIYVPDASVSAYTSITDSDNPFSRSNVIAKIYPISLLLTDSPSAWLIYNRS